MKMIRHYIGYIIVVATLFFIFYNIYQSWPELKRFFVQRPDKRIFLSFFPAVVSTILAAWGVRRLLESKNNNLGLSRAYLAFYLPQYGKYIPGKVWSFVMAWSLSKRLQLTVTQILFVTLFNTLFGTMVYIAFSTLVLSAFLNQYRVIFLMIGIAIIVSWGFFPFYCQIFEKLVSRFTKYNISLKLNYYRFIQVTGIFTLSWIVFFYGFALLLMGFGVSGVWDILKVMAASSIGWLVGFYSLIVPGGVGVREVTSYFVLSQMFTKDFALAMPIIFRAWMSVYEVLIFIICGILYYFENLRLRKEIVDNKSSEYLIK